MLITDYTVVKFIQSKNIVIHITKIEGICHLDKLLIGALNFK